MTWGSGRPVEGDDPAGAEGLSHLPISFLAEQGSERPAAVKGAPLFGRGAAHP
jgi:hypothetical protein